MEAYGKKWHLNKAGYYVRHEIKQGKKKAISLHRYIWEQERGEIPEGHDIHHINGDKLDNRIDNLLCLTKAEHTRVHLLENWNDEDYVQWMRELTKKRWESPEYRAKMCQMSRDMWKSEEYREKQSRSLKAALNTKESKEKRSKSHKALWAKPEHRAKMKAIGLGKFARETETRECKICETEFQAYKHGPKKCCSQSCYDIFRRPGKRRLAKAETLKKDD